MSRKIQTAFTLIEMLVGMAVFSILVVLLFEIVNQSSKVGRATNAETERLDKVGIAFDMMRRDLKGAVLPIDPNSTNSFQFLVNPAAGVPILAQNPDSAFWQSPVAANISGGDLAIVGYFIKKDTASTPPRFSLCRLQIDPYDPNMAGAGDYKIESGNPWLTEQILQDRAPATAPEYSGLILEGAIGLWIRAIDDNGDYFSQWDSRLSKKLPKALEVALVVVDDQTLVRVTSLPNPQSTSPENLETDINIFLNQLPEDVRKGVRVFRTVLPISNYRYSAP